MTSNRPLAIQISPQTYARIGGLLYLIVIVIGFVGEVFIRGRLAGGDAMTTAAVLRALEPVWRAGIAAELLLLICAAGVTWALYVLLRPVSRELALLAVMLNVIAMAVETAVALRLVEALFPLGDAAYLRAFDAPQLAALARLAIRAHANGFAIALIFCGCTCVLFGLLIYRSGYLPRAIGVLYLLAGISYVILNFAQILAPSFADRAFPVLAVPAFVGETATSLWLLVKGVNADKWRQREPLAGGGLAPAVHAAS